MFLVYLVLILAGGPCSAMDVQAPGNALDWYRQRQADYETAASKDPTVVPQDYDWLHKNGLVRMVGDRYVVSPVAVRKYEKRSAMYGRLSVVFGLASAGLIAGGSAALSTARQKNKQEGSFGGFVEGMMAISLFTAGANTVVATGLSIWGYKRNRNKAEWSRETYKEYLVVPRVTRNGGGLEVAWRW